MTRENRAARDVVVDVDTGVDDALALLYLLRDPDVRVRAITCVAGNVPVDTAVRNTLAVLDAAGEPGIPVAKGEASSSTSGQAAIARPQHGPDGLGGCAPLEPPGEPCAQPAPDLLWVLLDDARREPADRRPWVFLLGPATNLAAVCAQTPEAISGAGRIVIVGGSVSAPPDFNLRHDPRAAATVIEAAERAGVPVTLYGAQVFGRVCVNAEDVEGWTASPDPAVRLAGRLVDFRIRRGRPVVPDGAAGDDCRPGGGLGDAGAVAAILGPHRPRTCTHRAWVELSEGPDLGCVRLQDPQGRDGGCVEHVVDVDAAAVAAHWARTVGGVRVEAVTPAISAGAAPR